MKIFRSLRFRLIIRFMMIFGAIQITLSAVALVAREQHLHNYFDRELMQRTEAMAAEAVKAQKGFFAPQLQRIVGEQTKSIYFREFYVQMRDASGQVVARSDNLGQFQLPMDPAVIAHLPNPQSQRFDTLGGKDAETLTGSSETLRMVTVYINEPGVKPFHLQVATSLQHVKESIAFLRLLFAVGIPVGLLTAAVASWFVAGHAVRKIHAVSELARQVTPERLGYRLETPDTDDEIGQMVERLNAMLSRLEAGFEAQERFIFDASHELKTPVSTLLTEAQVLKLGNATPQQHQHFIDSVEQEMRRLGSMIESLLLLTRSDRAGSVVHREIRPINDIVMSAVKECEPVARHSGIELNVTLAMSDQDDSEMLCRGDGELLTAMVSNLVRNAISFSPPQRAVDIEVVRRDSQAAIIVRDRGPGIPPESLDTIFNRFAQGSHPGPRRGTGLGLAIARTVAQLHGGDISAANIDGGGCQFTVLLPLLASKQPH